MNNHFVFRLLFLIAAAAFGAVAVHAEDANAVKARMVQRQGSVDALKQRKVVGENNQGFLEARGAAAAADQAVIESENADRRAVYAAIAARTGTSADSVGKRRAQKLAAESKPGVWIQDASGSWRQK